MGDVAGLEYSETGENSPLSFAFFCKIYFKINKHAFLMYTVGVEALLKTYERDQC